MSSIDGSEPTSQSDLRIIGLGVIISAMLYGGVATLALTYIPLLLKTSHTISRRMRNFLLAYVTFMVTASTVNTATLITAFTIGHSILNYAGTVAENGLDLSTFPNGIAGALCVTFASWGADGFMLWRCAVLYEGISRPRRLATLTILILSGLASLGFCIYLLVNPNGELLDVITIITTIINIIAAILIAARVLYFQRYIQTVASERNNQYTTVIIICVESAALIILFSILYIVLVAIRSPASFIFRQSLVHINVISPLLIVYRVALGKALTCSARRPEDGPAVSALHFASTRNTSSVPEYEQSLPLVQDRLFHQ